MQSTKESKEYKMPTPLWEQVKQLAIKKEIKLDILLQPADIKLNEEMPIHTAWAFKAIYKHAYPTNRLVSRHDAPKDQDAIARMHHGIQHTTRVATYIPVLANLYRRYEDQEALDLKPEDIKLLQIAAIFHDSAREDENKDLWDLDSGIFLYFYLTQTLKVDPQKAKKITEATVNKDAGTGKHEENETPKKYYELIETESGTIEWKEAKEIPPRNIFQKLIHDADSFDIKRARPAFNAEFLDFFQQIIAKGNPEAENELAELSIEITSLIEEQGDSYYQINCTIKKTFEHENAFQAVAACIAHAKHDYPILRKYAQLLPLEEIKNPLLEFKPYDKEKGYTLENLKAALREGKVIARGLSMPSAVKQKMGRDPEFVSALEFRKIFRRSHIETRTRKPDQKLGKTGNVLRSGAVLGWGGKTFSSAGCLSIDVDMANIKRISKLDLGGEESGFHGKKHLKHVEFKSSEEKLRKELMDLVRKQKLGGDYIEYDEGIQTHSEILYNMQDYDAIYFTKDPVWDNQAIIDQAYPAHPHAPILEAIFIKNEYEKAARYYAQQELNYAEQQYTKESLQYKDALEKYNYYQNKKMPILEYSGVHNTLEFAPDYSKDNIKKMWVEMCSSYMQTFLQQPFQEEKLRNLSIENLKLKSMYKGKEKNYHNQSVYPADTNYDASFRQEIDDLIKHARDEILAKHETQFAINITVRQKLNALGISDEFVLDLLAENTAPEDLQKILNILEHEEMKVYLASKENYRNFLQLSTYQSSRFRLLDAHSTPITRGTPNVFDGLKKLFSNNLLTQKNLNLILIGTRSGYPLTSLYAELICDLEKGVIDAKTVFLTTKDEDTLKFFLPQMNQETIWEKFRNNLDNVIIMRVLLKFAFDTLIKMDQPLPPISVRGYDGKIRNASLITAAALFGDFDSVTKIMQEQKTNINQQDEDGFTLLHYCTLAGAPTDPQLIGHLIDQGADINIEDKSGKKPFYYIKAEHGFRLDNYRCKNISLSALEWISSEFKKIFVELYHSSSSKQALQLREALSDFINSKAKSISASENNRFMNKIVYLILDILKTHHTTAKSRASNGLFDHKFINQFNQLYSILKIINNELLRIPVTIPKEENFKFIEPNTKFPKDSKAPGLNAT